MTGRGIIIGISLVAVLATVASPALAHGDSGTETLAWLEHVDVEIDATDSGALEVSWDIQVTDGVPVNVYLMPAEGYADYTDPLKPEFSYYPAHSKNYTESFSKTVSLPDDIVYYLVIENGGYSSMDLSTVDYEVEWDEESSIFDSPWCWPAAIILALILALFGVITYRRMAGGDVTTSPKPGDVPAPSRVGVAELTPQPGPPDVPEGGGGPGATEDNEPPALGTTVYRGPDGGATQLGPQPEPPDLPTSGDVVMPPGEGATELSPQPEPPDMPRTDAWERPVLDPLHPDAETLYVSDMPTAQGTVELGPQPGSPDASTATELGPQPEPPDHPTVQKGPVDTDGD